MSKAKRPFKIDALADMPLTCTSFGDHSEIDVWIKRTKTWETLATTHSVAGFDAEDVAAFFIRAVKQKEAAEGNDEV